MFFLFGLTLSRCQTYQNFLSWVERQRNPLQTFSAENKKYFPDFIKTFFPLAKNFESDFPVLDHARSGLLLIDVKQLSKNDLLLNESNLSWSEDGVYLAYEIMTGAEKKILLKDLIGNFSKELLVLPQQKQNFLEGMVLSSSYSYNANLRWSKDSTRFAFMSNGGVGEFNIYVGAPGKKEEPLAKSQTKDGYAIWNPSRDELAFVSARSGNGDIYISNVLNKKIERISHSDQVDIFPEWFPDGHKLVYSSGDAMRHDLLLSERKNGLWLKSRPITKWPKDILRPTVSPNGQMIAFYGEDKASSSGFSESSRIWNVFVIPYEENKTWQEHELKKMIVAKDVIMDLNTGPSWSPDSKKLFFVKKDSKKFNPIAGYDLFNGSSYLFDTKTRMNRDILVSKLGVMSFRAQVGSWDRVFLALTNQGLQLQKSSSDKTSKIVYLN